MSVGDTETLREPLEWAAGACAQGGTATHAPERRFRRRGPRARPGTRHGGCGGRPPTPSLPVPTMEDVDRVRAWTEAVVAGSISPSRLPPLVGAAQGSRSTLVAPSSRPSKIR